MESRILRPLTWFGLLESRREREGVGEPRASHPVCRAARKTPLFDCFLKFNVQIERPATRH